MSTMSELSKESTKRTKTNMTKRIIAEVETYEMPVGKYLKDNQFLNGFLDFFPTTMFIHLSIDTLLKLRLVCDDFRRVIDQIDRVRIYLNYATWMSTKYHGSDSSPKHNIFAILNNAPILLKQTYVDALPNWFNRPLIVYKMTKPINVFVYKCGANYFIHEIIKHKPTGLEDHQIEIKVYCLTYDNSLLCQLIMVEHSTQIVHGNETCLIEHKVPTLLYEGYVYHTLVQHGFISEELDGEVDADASSKHEAIIQATYNMRAQVSDYEPITLYGVSILTNKYKRTQSTSERVFEMCGLIKIWDDFIKVGLK